MKDSQPAVGKMITPGKYIKADNERFSTLLHQGGAIQ